MRSTLFLVLIDLLVNRNNNLHAIQAQREAARFDISREALINVFDVWRGKVESARRANDIRGQQNVLRQFIKNPKSD